jgi:hypothetical protein
MDLRGTIGPVGIDAIQASVLYRALSHAWGDVEVWPATGRPNDGWWYYWLVSQAGGAVRALALVRCSGRRNTLQERLEGPFGQELWADIAAADGEARSGAAASQRRV